MDQKLLKILQNCKNLREMKQTHHQILIHGLQDDKFLLPKLIDLSSTLHYLDYGLQIFQTADSPTLVAHNTLIKSFNQNHRRKEAFLAFVRMKESTLSPNNFTFTFLLKSCKSSQDFQQGTQIHTQILKSGFGFHLFVQNTLLDFYSKCGAKCDEVRHVFDEMPERDVVSWNSIISAYMSRGDTEVAIQMFECMPCRNIVSWNTVLAGLSKRGEMELAGRVFERMPVKDTVSWNAMITGYVKMGHVGSALEIFNQMPDKDVVSWTAMISGYAKAGDLQSARQFFDQMPVKNEITWNAMIAGYVQNHLFDIALYMFHQMLMRGEFRPSDTTLLSVLSACAHLGALEQGNWIDSYITKNNIDLTTALGNALIDMYAKCGDVKKAREVFNHMEKKCIITWTTMISGLAFNGESSEALSLFHTMCRERIEPDDVIFITVLSACTHGGMIEEGKRVFDQMVKEFKIKPRIEHYGCMVDLLGRAHKLEEANQLIESMPVEPNAVIWATLLGSCRVHGNKELAAVASRKILDLEPSNSGYRVLVSNLNAAIGQWENVSNMRAGMREEGMEKVPGCSSIQVGMGVHEFLVKDTRHEQRKEIYETLDGLTLQLKAVGYVPCISRA